MFFLFGFIVFVLCCACLFQISAINGLEKERKKWEEIAFRFREDNQGLRREIDQLRNFKRGISGVN